MFRHIFFHSCQNSVLNGKAHFDFPLGRADKSCEWTHRDLHDLCRLCTISFTIQVAGIWSTHGASLPSLHFPLANRGQQKRKESENMKFFFSFTHRKWHTFSSTVGCTIKDSLHTIPRKNNKYLHIINVHYWRFFGEAWLFCSFKVTSALKTLIPIFSSLSKCKFCFR
jgi:hypothetical protein